MRRLASIVSVVRLLLVVGTPTALAVYENKLVIELHGGRGERVNVKRAGLSGVAAAPTSRELQRPGGGLAPLVSAVGPIGVSRDDSQQLSANIREVKDLVVNLDRSFNDRLDRLAERITRLEANQKSANWAMASANDFRPLLGHTNKKIRVFTATSTHENAAAVCKAHGGKLLEVLTDLENRRVTDFVQNYQPSVYWLGALDAKLSLAVPIGRYHNFGSAITDDEPERACVALSASGKWSSLACDELHAFICEFN